MLQGSLHPLLQSPRRALARTRIATRTLTSSRSAPNVNADLVRAKEVGAREETQHVTEMDELLRLSRTSCICSS